MTAVAIRMNAAGIVPTATLIEVSAGTVGALVNDGGLRAIDAGRLARAAELESLGYLHMALREPLGTGFRSAVKFIG